MEKKSRRSALVREGVKEKMMHRRQWALSAAAIAGLSLLGCDSQSSLPVEGMDLTGAEHGKDFALFDAQGQQRSVKDFAGSVVVVFFCFFLCPDVCPTTLQELVEAKALLGPLGERLKGVFITVDPERDTPEVLQAYTQAFSPDFVGLSGTPDQIAEVARSFKVFYKKVPGSTPNSYTIDHSAGMYMYDTQGQLRVYHRYGQGAQALATDAKLLLGLADK